ncbi:MAG TPA: hypothetical protein VE398_00355 [Acidobacteriota bacterium]|nr:hypothetical protein [Acidobacteriota bacterium]
MAQTATTTARSEPVIYRSLALTALLQQLEPGRKYSILDLGKASGDNINFWAQIPARICLPDFYPSLLAEVGAITVDPESEEEPSYDALFEGLLCSDSDRLFDIVLGWDVFNYLESAKLESFVRVLRKVCHPGTFVFVLVSTLHQIPVEPTNFKILDRERLLYENHSPATKPCPRYQPRDIKLMMTGFEVLVSFLLRHGMQEYVFVCQR